MTVDDLKECAGCNTWQHKRLKVCPKCGRSFQTEKDLIEDKKARINELRRKASQASADKRKEMSRNLTQLCISKYEKEGRLPPAEVVSKWLYKDTGTKISSTTLRRELKALGWYCMGNYDGWQKEE